MINHARTLLINKDGASLPIDVLGGEYVSPTYLETSVPSYVKSVRKVIFGAKPDTLMLNYRTRQLLTLLHSSELEEFVLELDPRITYSTTDETELFTNVFQKLITDLSDNDGDLVVLNEDSNPDPSGRCMRSWTITVTSGPQLRITPDWDLSSETEEDLTVTDGISSSMVIPHSRMKLLLKNPSVGDSWKLQSAIRPYRDIGEITNALSKIGEPVILELFGVGSKKANSEPFKTFYNLWRDHKELPYKLGGLVLATIYRTEEYRISD